MKKFSIQYITRSAVISAMYFILSMVFQPLTFSPIIQLRVAESLAMLPFIMSEGVVGVAIGCLLTNIFSPFALYDMIFGTLATLISALLTYKIKNIWLAGLPPIIVNALILPAMWTFLGVDGGYFYFLVSITLSQAIAVYGLGVPLVIFIKNAVPSFITNPNMIDNQTKK